VCDSRANIKGKSDHHFIVGLNVAERNVRTVVCKGTRFPMTVPMPTVCVTPMSLPMCQPATEKAMLEEQYWLGEMAAGVGEDLEQVEVYLFSSTFFGRAIINVANRITNLKYR
jgi:hypothetical protein